MRPFDYRSLAFNELDKIIIKIIVCTRNRGWEASRIVDKKTRHASKYIKARASQSPLISCAPHSQTQVLILKRKTKKENISQKTTTSEESSISVNRRNCAGKSITNFYDVLCNPTIFDLEKCRRKRGTIQKFRPKKRLLEWDAFGLVIHFLEQCPELSGPVWVIPEDPRTSRNTEVCK